MRRHPVLERLEVAVVRLEALAARGQRRDVILVPVQSLPAGDQLEAAEDEIEAVRELWPRWIGMCVERPLRHREAGDEEEVRSVLATSPIAEPALVCGREVGLAHDRLARRALDQLLRGGEVDGRNLRLHLGEELDTE